MSCTVSSSGRFSQGSLFSQQQHKSVQPSCAFRQLHLLDEHRLVVQPHLTSSMTAFGAGRRGVMTGTHALPSGFHPNASGDGSSGLATLFMFQISAW